MADRFDEYHHPGRRKSDRHASAGPPEDDEHAPGPEPQTMHIDKQFNITIQAGAVTAGGIINIGPDAAPAANNSTGETKDNEAQ